LITKDVYNQKVEQIFIRLANKAEKKGGINRSRGFNTFPDKEGYEKIYKPYGEQGAGYYYSKILTDNEI
jgi:hypothetical protein